MRRFLRTQSISRKLLPTLAVGLAFAAIAASPRAQQPATGGKSVPLASYIPADNLVLYYEYEGVGSQADAWKKTATYKVLNDTSVGAMFEDVGGQVMQKLLARLGNRRMTGADSVALLKHIAQHGFVLAIAGKAEAAKPDAVVFVFRGAFRQGVRKPFAQLLAGFSTAESRPTPQAKGKHKYISNKLPNGEQIAWWIDERNREDLVLVFQGLDLVLATINGESPNALENPIRAGVAKSAAGFSPLGLGFLDVTFATENLPPTAKSLGLQSFKRIEFAGGFNGEAIQTVTRIVAPRPRTGLLSLLDQPSFQKNALPPIPSSVKNFSVFSVDLSKAFDQVLAAAKKANPNADAAVKSMLDSVKAKTKLDLQTDILAHLGPRVAVYALPAAQSAETAVQNPFAMLNSGAAIPKLTILVEVGDTEKIGQALDRLMVSVNQQLRAMTPPAAPAAGAEPAAEGRPGAAAKKAAAGSGIEFRLIPSGTDKTYMLNLPQQYSSIIPESIRPTVRLGGKYLAISLAPDAARLAVEAKESAKPPGDLGNVFQHLPSNMLFLGVEDSRETTPAILANFPRILQLNYNSAMTLPGMAAAAGGEPAMPGGGEGARPGPGGFGPQGGPGFTPPGGSGAGFAPPGGSGGQFQGPGGRGFVPPGGSGGFPGGPGEAQPPADGQPAGDDSPLVITFDAAKLPKADAIKSLLFPATFSGTIDAQGLVIVSRESFPNMVAPTMAAALMFPAIQAGRDAAKRAANPDAPAGNPTGALVPGGPRGARGPAFGGIEEEAPGPGGARGRGGRDR